MVKKLPACYGIRKGRGAPVVVHSWSEVVAKTNGFPGADFRKFKTPEEASDYANQAEAEGGALNPAPEGWATMWFDGGCRGNPGPSGAGAVIFNDKDKELYSGYKYLGEGKTNNEAEYESVILGLKAAAKLGAKQVVVKGDSMLVIQQMMGKWRVSAPKLVGLHKQASEVVKLHELKCTWHHVQRKHNVRADLLANIAMDSKSMDEIYDPSTGVANTPPNAAATGAPAAGGASPFPGFSSSDVADAAALAGGRAKRPGPRLEAEKDKQVRRLDGTAVAPAEEKADDAAAAAAAMAAAAVDAVAAPPAAPVAPAAPAAPATSAAAAPPAAAAAAAPSATAAAPAAATPAAPPAPGSVPI